MSDDAAPTTGQIRTAVEPLFQYDGRLRALEVAMAEVQTLRPELIRMEDRITGQIAALATSIESNKPKPIWPAVGAMAAVFAVAMALFAAIYGTPPN